MLDRSKGRLAEIYGIPVDTILVDELESEELGSIARVIRITLKKHENRPAIKRGLLSDWDDTLYDYSIGKDSFHRELAVHVGDNKLANVFGLINSEARVLPAAGVHPKRYSPRIELHALSMILEKRVNPYAVTSEVDAHFFLKEYIAPELRKSKFISVDLEVKDGKEYFIQGKRPIDLDFNVIPEAILPGIWNLYRKHLLERTIIDNELHNYNLNKEDYFAIVTFGEPLYQLEKMISSFRFIAEAGKRLPDQIFIFTQGRKWLILRDIVNSFPHADFVYVDDSVSQLKEVLQKPIQRLHLAHAARPNSKRSVLESPRGVFRINTSLVSHTEVLEKCGQGGT